MIQKITLRTVLAAALFAVTPATALAQAYPNKQVRVIIPFPPGGTLDTVGRLLAQKLGEQTGQVFVIENRQEVTARLVPTQLPKLRLTATHCYSTRQHLPPPPSR